MGQPLMEDAPIKRREPYISNPQEIGYIREKACNTCCQELNQRTSGYKAQSIINLSYLYRALGYMGSPEHKPVLLSNKDQTHSTIEIICQTIIQMKHNHSKA